MLFSFLNIILFQSMTLNVIFSCTLLTVLFEVQVYLFLLFVFTFCAAMPHETSVLNKFIN